MSDRRKFLAGLSAVAGSVALSACGGGSGSADSGAVVDAATSKRLATSANNTTVPPAAYISDQGGARWTIRNGVAYRYNQPGAWSQNVTLLLWYGAQLYLQSTTMGWRSWNGGAWVESVDPRIPAAAAISGAMPIHFYGMNSHYIDGGMYAQVPLSTQVASLQDLGIKVVRQDAYRLNDLTTLVDTVIPQMAPILVSPCLNFYPWNDPSLNGVWPTESTAYNYAYSMAAQAASLLAGKVPTVEFGNDFDIDGHAAQIGRDGTDITDYDATVFPIMRGALRGSIDGWRSVDTNRATKIMANGSGGWLHFGFLDGLFHGTAPDGSSGHPTIAPDLLAWHWYSDMGNLLAATGGTGTYNVLQRLQSYGLPIVLTELGSRNNLDEGDAQAYMYNAINTLSSVASTYNLVGIMWYEMYDDLSGPYGLMSTGWSQKPRYTTMKNAVSAFGMV